MKTRANGADIKVVASSIVEQISFLGLDSLTSFYDKDASVGTFKRFVEAIL